VLVARFVLPLRGQAPEGLRALALPPRPLK
jgi:hypothetical protein